MRALDVCNHPAVGAVDDDEIQRDGAAVIVESDRNIGLVELLAQDRYSDWTELPGRALHQEIVRRVPRRAPRGAQALIEELPCGVGIARQSL